MVYKSAFFFITLLIGSLGLPAAPETDISQFFVQSDPNARIVGGTVAPEGSAPHMAMMTTGVLIQSFICGASIISTRTVLTAAHCIDAVFSRLTGLSSSLRITVGTNRVNTGGVRYSVSRNVTHQHWVRDTIKNDIGLFILASTISTSATIQPVPLSYNYAAGGVPSRVAGFGRIGANQALSTQLLELYTTTIDGNQCALDVEAAAIALNVRNAPPVEPHIEICTFHSAGFGNCNGDSGSALIRTDTQEQIGIVSWGFPCALGAPDMFARVSAYGDWIDQNIV